MQYRLWPASILLLPIVCLAARPLADITTLAAQTYNTRAPVTLVHVAVGGQRLLLASRVGMTQSTCADGQGWGGKCR